MSVSWFKSKTQLIKAVIFIITLHIVNSTRITQQEATIRDVRNEFLDPFTHLILGRLSQAVYFVNETFYKPVTESLFTFQCDENCGHDDNSDDILDINDIYDSSSVKIIDWIDHGSTEVLIVTLRTKHEISQHDQIESDNTKLIVVFRGTEEIQDWLVNLNSKKVPFGSPNHTRGLPKEMTIPGSTINVQSQSPTPSNLTSSKQESSLPILTHAGFNQVFRVYDDILHHINPILKDMDTLYVTGHSLGGANAQLFSTMYAFHNPTLSVYCSTFGQPRTGNIGFKYFAESIWNLNTWRFVHKNDIVPRVPPYLDDFTHTGHLMWKRPYLPNNIESNKKTIQSENPVYAYYRQVGSKDMSLNGVHDYSLALLGPLSQDEISVYVQDHSMSTIVNTWLIHSSKYATYFESL